MTGLQVRCAVSQSGPGTRYLNPLPVHELSVREGLVFAVITLSGSAPPGVDPPMSTRTRVAGVIRSLEYSC